MAGFGGLWQDGGMAKAYRTDILKLKKWQDAISTLKDPLPPERVNCPVKSCTCSYDIYDYILQDSEGNKALLLGTLEKKHPGHEDEIIILNERKPREDFSQAAVRIVRESTKD